MSGFAWTVCGIALLIAAAIGAEAWIKRGKRRPLSSSQPQPAAPPKLSARARALKRLGIDYTLVEKAHAKNQNIEARHRKK